MAWTLSGLCPESHFPRTCCGLRYTPPLRARPTVRGFLHGLKYCLSECGGDILLTNITAVPVSLPEAPASRVWINPQVPLHCHRGAACQVLPLRLRSEPSSGSPLWICQWGLKREQVSPSSLDPSVRTYFQKSSFQSWGLGVGEPQEWSVTRHTAVSTLGP